MPAELPSPAEAIAALAARLCPVDAERVAAAGASGRVLGGDVRLDRDSPACSVSAMDGYAVRAEELAAGAVRLAGEARIGRPPETLPPGAALRIYTGSPVPIGADTVARLEWIDEAEGLVALRAGLALERGADIRRQAENGAAGALVLAEGLEVTAAAASALATIGVDPVAVRRRVRVAIVTTGDELDPATSRGLAPWRLRDSNGPALAALLGGAPWVVVASVGHVEDQPDALARGVAQGLDVADAVILTGGVSKGAYDYVPGAVVAAGGEVVFHRIRARPGQPTLGAVAGGRAVIGLPGNPLAVLTAGRRVVVPVLRRLAGFATIDPPAPVVELHAWRGAPIPLTWWRPVTMRSDGVAELASLRGSGDVCGPAASAGFVEAPPGCESIGPLPLFAWRP